MKDMGKLALTSVGLVVGAFAVLGYIAPAFAVADEAAPDDAGEIVISLGEAVPQPDGGAECEVVRWVEGGTEVTPVPDVRVCTGAEE